MEQLKITYLKLVLPGLLLSFAVNAQKLPNVQQAGLRAPADIKVDGKATEWGNKFQAYNKATQVFYTISNDDDNLYLTIQATDQQVIAKILAGGVTFIVSGADKKNKLMPVTVVYPVLSQSRSKAIAANWTSKFRSDDTSMPETDNTAELNAMNTQLNDSKEIFVTGIESITDSVLSVYNEHGIKASAQFGNKKAYIYELALPLKYLQQLIPDGTRFNYNIKLNGLKTNNRHSHSGDPSDPKVIAAAQFQELTSPTDFSGKYTLAKK